jgi:cytidylate kinase
MMKNYVITIARGFGSGGRQIGKLLGAELNIPCYESQILAMASEYSGLNQSLFVEVDERLKGRGFLSRLKLAPSNDEVLSPSEKRFVSDDNLFNIQVAIMKELARSESCIIVGKAANWILRKSPNVICVYIEAPRETCLREVRERLGVSESEAEQMIEKTDKYRADYFKHYTKGRVWTDPVLYDLILNSAKVSHENCVAIIKEYARLRGFISEV